MSLFISKSLEGKIDADSLFDVNEEKFSSIMYLRFHDSIDNVLSFKIDTISFKSVNKKTSVELIFDMCNSNLEKLIYKEIYPKNILIKSKYLNIISTESNISASFSKELDLYKVTMQCVLDK